MHVKSTITFTPPKTTHAFAATAQKIEVERVARPSRPDPGRDALVTLKQEFSSEDQDQKKLYL